ncbi:DNA polymerase I [Aerococcus kribbianus]|uniref:DNA polymerase I n=1 Tax=Aerococcus kribbianus TaxID=2999064 RepID=A0A9X3FQM4_9LACT|nr:MULTISPECIES: DNA polymerase I [unclassified Aerococcus]MCZ0717766.1 DNA polymerase I [Aerococcus sp. YH-aer221]MCZ0726054.1 DNA polymerase I [Aerococcus sp. YH-aer222]
MTTKNKKLLLFDGSSLAFRAFFAIPNFDTFVNKNGLHTNALFAFHSMFKTVLDKEAPSHALVAWDAGKTTFRTEMYGDYKGGRQKTPAEFREQMPFFNVMLDAFGVSHYGLVNYEADDIIGTLAMQAADQGFEVVIVSGDRDLIQLARPNIRVDITRKGVSQLEPYTPETIDEKYGITPQQIVDMKGLMGDSSDNYPGVTKIGEKTALKLLHDYESMEGVYDHIDEMKASKRKENLINDKEQAFLSKKLARIATEAPVEVSLDDIVRQDIDVQALMTFYKDMDFNQFMSQLLDKTDNQDLLSEDWEDVDYHYLSQADQVSAELFSADTMALYMENLAKNYHEGQIEMVAWGSKDQIYVADANFILKQADFQIWLADVDKKKVVYDAKRSQVMLSKLGLDFAGIQDDVLIAGYLLTAKDLSKDLAELAHEFGIDQLAFDESIYGKGAKRALPEDQETMASHLARKIAAIWQLQSLTQDQLASNEMLDLYQDLELPLAKVLAQMEIQGVRVDRKQLETMQAEFDVKLGELENDIYQIAGHDFNINSPKQLGKVLFEELELPVIKKTKTGYSTAQSVLEKLQGKSPIIDYILDYRQLAKLQSTYVAGLQDFIQEDHKIHTRFQQTLTTTGRLSSADPNLQNIPIRSDEGRKIRKAFIPSHSGWKIFSSDYSQIELRVLAHLSGDDHMRDVFQAGQDIHQSTAMKVYGVDSNAVSKNMRRNAKAVNFGIVYGISDYGLSQNLNISRKEAQSFIDAYFESFPKIEDYMDRVVQEARDKGYAQTMFNRRRYLPDIKAKNFNVRSFAERNAMNTPIQGTAADIIKFAMLAMDKALKEKNLQARMLLQVHDELIFECPEEEVPVLEDLVPEIMASAVDLSIPLTVESSYGDNWYDA